MNPNEIVLTMQGERQALSEEAFGLSADGFCELPRQCRVLGHEPKQVQQQLMQ